MVTGECVCPANSVGRTCEACQCNNNTEKCLRTGECLECQYNTTGFYCEECQNGTYGDPLNQECKGTVTSIMTDDLVWRSFVTTDFAWQSRIFTACGCDPVGSLGSDCDRATGQCVCKRNVEGRNCSSCVVSGSAAVELCVMCHAVGRIVTCHSRWRVALNIGLHCLWDQSPLESIYYFHRAPHIGWMPRDAMNANAIRSGPPACSVMTAASAHARRMPPTPSARSAWRDFMVFPTCPAQVSVRFLRFHCLYSALQLFRWRLPLIKLL